MKNPITDLTPSLLSKLGSIVIHAGELMSPDGHAYDRLAMEQLLDDAEVRDWLDAMDRLAMLPKRRIACWTKARPLTNPSAPS